jgi:DNA repair protein RadC
MPAVMGEAVSLIIAHNHLSGILTPSDVSRFGTISRVQA